MTVSLPTQRKVILRLIVSSRRPCRPIELWDHTLANHNLKAAARDIFELNTLGSQSALDGNNSGSSEVFGSVLNAMNGFLRETSAIRQVALLQS